MSDLVSSDLKSIGATPDEGQFAFGQLTLEGFVTVAGQNFGAADA